MYNVYLLLERAGRACFIIVEEIWQSVATPIFSLASKLFVRKDPVNLCKILQPYRWIGMGICKDID